MKKTRIIVVGLIIIAVICGGFFYYMWNSQQKPIDKDLTKVQKLITKDLEKNYPESPRAVISLYNDIIKCYYDGEYTEEELDQLMEQTLCLFDEELLEQNPVDQYKNAVKTDILIYQANKCTIMDAKVCSTNDVLFIKDGDDELAYVTSNYYLKEGSEVNNTNQEYVLRKDEDGRWKMLHFYQVERTQE